MQPLIRMRIAKLRHVLFILIAVVATYIIVVLAYRFGLDFGIKRVQYVSVLVTHELTSTHTTISTAASSTSFTMLTTLATRIIPCNAQQFDILVIIHSALGHKEHRNAMRATWLSDWRTQHSYCHIFLFGDASNDVSESLRQSLQNESSTFGDILISNSVKEGYAALTNKTLEMLRLANQEFPQTKYVFKVDDDTIVHIPNLIEAIKKCELELGANGSFIAGSISWSHRPLRSKGMPWYVPESVYNKSTYPPFARGPAYLVSHAAILPLLRAWPPSPLLHLEDVNVGFLAESAGVRMIDPTGFYHLSVPNWCQFKKLRSAHYIQPKQMLNIWAEKINSTRGLLQC